MSALYQTPPGGENNGAPSERLVGLAAPPPISPEDKGKTSPAQYHIKINIFPCVLLIIDQIYPLKNPHADTPCPIPPTPPTPPETRRIPARWDQILSTIVRACPAFPIFRGTTTDSQSPGWPVQQRPRIKPLTPKTRPFPRKSNLIKPFKFFQRALVDFDGLCSADMYPIRTEQNLTPLFLLYWMLAQPFLDYASESSMRVAMPKLNRDTLSAAPLVVPPEIEQATIVEHIRRETKRIDSMADKVAEAIARLTEYRTALITVATTGKIDVRGVKIPSGATD